jgi:hypothetical protein
MLTKSVTLVFGDVVQVLVGIVRRSFPPRL